ncbi:hypothetical protein MTX80_22990 (plasmid) [Gordonia amicalis]|nr:hypothetical protein [Gordonia amicalis]UOG23788.1 hypothetical protein MTX80_22990 [Gordonia amicalis]
MVTPRNDIAQVPVAVFATQGAFGNRSAASCGCSPELGLTSFFGGSGTIFHVAVLLQQPSEQANRIAGVRGDPTTEADMVT